MFDQSLEIDYYQSQSGYTPFRNWFETLRDRNAKAVIDARLIRLRLGNLGRCATLGAGLYELKINYGPGYRVYFDKAAQKLILLLCGGDKSTQAQDIRIAHRYWKDFKETPK